mgnify:CR=1 FL=1
MNKDILTKAANQARGLAIDAIHACNSGHLGLPLGSADMGAVLFGEALSFNPDEPRWINRDRFILSAGHGSMFIYSWLHLAGFNLSLEDVKSFRKYESKTPGHPEFGETDGVECTTGPLGQGVGNAVGMAMSGKMSAAKFNTADNTILDYNVVALAGDGCLQEGVAQEAVSLAGHHKLDNLILIYDSNDVTLDAMADASQSYCTKQLFESYGWDVAQVDGHDLEAFAKVFDNAKTTKNGKPKLIIAKTIIGKGITEVQGTSAGHGEGGAKFAAEAHKTLGLPEESFYVSDDVRSYFAERKEARKAEYSKWLKNYNAWKAVNAELAELLESVGNTIDPIELLKTIPEFPAEGAAATRATGGKVLNAIAKTMPTVVSGSADLFGSTKNYLDDMGEFTPENRTGRNIRFGIREHAMGAIVNGFAYDGVWKALGATFEMFADYMRGAMRVSALAKIGSVHVLTHDSVGVGEDGPTHQPIELTSALRLIPNMDVMRPADAEETAGAFAAAIARNDGPTSLVLTRQNIPHLSSIPVQTRREGAIKGAYIAVKEKGTLEKIIIATGSELQHAVKAVESLGEGVRVVSMPCMERFERQDEAYKESILPASCTKRVAIEAGVSALWYKYASKVIGIDTFGFSAPGNFVMEQFGMTAEKVTETVNAL